MAGSFFLGLLLFTARTKLDFCRSGTGISPVSLFCILGFAVIFCRSGFAVLSAAAG